MKFDYLVENTSQEADALYELEQQGCKRGSGENPTSLVISRIMGERVFPYTIRIGKEKKIYWSSEENEGTDEMNKYKITQALMQDLKGWKEEQHIDDYAVVSWEDFKKLPDRVLGWQLNTGIAVEANNRLIAIIKWLNGEDVFEVGTPKYIVRMKSHKALDGYKYISFEDGEVYVFYGLDNATRFDSFEKASEWANKNFEVVEVDE